MEKLPTKHKKKEADLGLLFRTWISKNNIFTGTYELKDSRGLDYISFSEVTEEQLDSALRTTSDKGNLIRVITGTIGSADYVYFKNCPAYIVIRYPSGTYMIGAETFILERDRSKRKSLTSKRAEAISIRTIKL